MRRQQREHAFRDGVWHFRTVDFLARDVHAETFVIGDTRAVFEADFRHGKRGRDVKSRAAQAVDIIACFPPEIMRLVLSERRGAEEHIFLGRGDVRGLREAILIDDMEQIAVGG